MATCYYYAIKKKQTCIFSLFYLYLFPLPTLSCYCFFLASFSEFSLAKFGQNVGRPGTGIQSFFIVFFFFFFFTDSCSLDIVFEESE